jgi:hypothetical protein
MGGPSKILTLLLAILCIVAGCHPDQAKGDITPRQGAFAGTGKSTGKKKPHGSPSGIYGYVSGLSNGDQPAPFNTPKVQIIITDVRTKRTIKRIYTNANGDFTVSVPPGEYALTAVNPPSQAWGGNAKASVRVWRGFRTLTYIVFTL